MKTKFIVTISSKRPGLAVVGIFSAQDELDAKKRALSSWGLPSLLDDKKYILVALPIKKLKDKWSYFL